MYLAIVGAKTNSCLVRSGTLPYNYPIVKKVSLYPTTTLQHLPYNYFACFHFHLQRDDERKMKTGGNNYDETVHLKMSRKKERNLHPIETALLFFNKKNKKQKRSPSHHSKPCQSYSSRTQDFSYFQTPCDPNCAGPITFISCQTSLNDKS